MPGLVLLSAKAQARKDKEEHHDLGFASATAAFIAVTERGNLFARAVGRPPAILTAAESARTQLVAKWDADVQVGSMRLLTTGGAGGGNTDDDMDGEGGGAGAADGGGSGGGGGAPPAPAADDDAVIAAQPPALRRAIREFFLPRVREWYAGFSEGPEAKRPRTNYGVTGDAGGGGGGGAKGVGAGQVGADGAGAANGGEGAAMAAAVTAAPDGGDGGDGGAGGESTSKSYLWSSFATRQVIKYGCHKWAADGSHFGWYGVSELQSWLKDKLELKEDIPFSTVASWMKAEKDAYHGVKEGRPHKKLTPMMRRPRDGLMGVLRDVVDDAAEEVALRASLAADASRNSRFTSAMGESEVTAAVGGGGATPVCAPCWLPVTVPVSRH